MDQYKVIGVMSGSSLDGLDIAYCEFTYNEAWSFNIVHAETLAYNDEWLERLSALHEKSAYVFAETDQAYGHYIGEAAERFLNKYSLSPDLIASHGHTIFHKPSAKFTSQVGHGAAIHARTGIKVVSDFRTVDVALGGQGAPLVPIGDRLLFAGYDACLNLGGFSNISFEKNGTRIAFDISPCNILLNRAANLAGNSYDDAGKMAASGNINTALLGELNSLDFYRQHGARSLGREWIDETVWPIAEKHTSDPSCLLATFSAHIAEQLGKTIRESGSRTVLLTGGGAFNSHLISCIGKHTDVQLIVPPPQLVNYKEALIFALLGILRTREEVNTLGSVTGAVRDSCGGAVFG